MACLRHSRSPAWVLLLLAWSLTGSGRWQNHPPTDAKFSFRYYDPGTC
jgi:hypothetical protein